MESNWGLSIRPGVQHGQGPLTVASRQDRVAAVELLLMNLSLSLFRIHHCLLYGSLVRSIYRICVEFHIVLPDYSYCIGLAKASVSGYFRKILGILKFT